MLTRDELIDFAYYSQTFIASGADVGTMLSKMAKTFPSHTKQFQAASEMVRTQRGDLTQALVSNDIIDSAISPAISAGEKAGKLESVFENIYTINGRFNKIIDESLPKVKTPLFYLGFALLIGLSFIFFIFPLSLPRDETITNPLIEMTRYAMYLRNEHGTSLLSGAAVLILGVIVFFRQPDVRQSMFNKLFDVPLIGVGLYELFIAQFGKYYAMMREAGVPEAQSISLAADLMPDAIRGDLTILFTVVEQADASLIDNDENIPERWPILFTNALQIGRETGKEVDLLHQNCEKILEKGEERITKFINLTNKIGVLIVALIIGLLMISVLAMNASKITQMS